MRRAAIVLVGLVALGGALPAFAASVQIRDNSFSPATVTVDVGGTVNWSYSGASSHTVTADNGSFNSGTIDLTHTSYNHRFNTSGTFLYYCSFHGAPGGQGMAGKVIVRAAPAPSPTRSSVRATPKKSATPTPSASVSRSASPSATPSKSPRASASPTARTSGSPRSTIPGSPLAAPGDDGGLGNGTTIAIVLGALLVMGLAITLGARRLPRRR